MNPGQPESDLHIESPEQAADAPTTSRTRIFVMFDVDHDRDLYELLCAQSRAPGSGFDVVDSSQGSNEINAKQMSVRCRFREADQVILICGAHTETSVRIEGEFEVMRDEGIPFFMLWGRREIMCTKPTGAKTSEGMYSWTGQILQDQIAYNQREARASRETARTRIAATEVAAFAVGPVTLRS